MSLSQLRSPSSSLLYRPLRILLLLCSVVLFAAPLKARATDLSKNLSPQYRHWLNEEVSYIINSDERREFLSLKSDVERDNFIKAFWDVRNPDPGSGVNEYKAEHYRRLAYANQMFGNIAAQNGWRTDEGRIYITLGPPQQKASYPNARNMRPLLIWFYQSTTPALPTHFYVVFYKRSIGEPYTLYSPYQDGPMRLVTGLEAMNDQKKSLDIIKRSLGDEVARTTLSLIPTEPVNMDEYKPSLTSDLMLGTIESLPDNPLTKEMLDARRGREVVTHRILLGAEQAELEAMTFREAEGRQGVHYLLRYREPVEALMGTLPNGKPGYSMTLQTKVSTKDGKTVYTQYEKLGGEVTGLQASIARKKRFAAESRLPLAPGDYRLAVTLTNDLNHVGLQETGEIVVPPTKDAGWGMSHLLAFSPQPPVKEATNKLPFSVAGVRFTPRGIDDVSQHAGDPLRVLYQLWNAPADPASLAGHKIRMTYSYGRVQSPLSPVSDSEEIDASDFDASGALLTGHTISTTGLAQGTYRLIITATDETTGKKAYAAMSFHIVSDTDPTDLWTAYDITAANGHSDAIDDYKRGLSAAVQANNDEAIAWFRHSLADDERYLPALTRLVDLLSQSGRYKDVAELSRKYPVTHEISPQTVMQMAQADAQTGDRSRAASILEAELQFQAPTADLYLALAKVYQDEGNSAKAEEYKHRAAALKD